jgi:hypothetical protein
MMLRRHRVMSVIERKHLMESPYATHHWYFCIACGLPMFGLTTAVPQSGSYTCGSCYTTNIFDNSIEPTGSHPEFPEPFRLGSKTGNRLEMSD